MGERDRAAGDRAERRTEHHVTQIVLALAQSRGANVRADRIRRDSSLPSEALTNDGGCREHRRCVSRWKRIAATVGSFACHRIFERLRKHPVQQVRFNQVRAGRGQHGMMRGAPNRPGADGRDPLEIPVADVNSEREGGRPSVSAARLMASKMACFSDCELRIVSPVGSVTARDFSTSSE